LICIIVCLIGISRGADPSPDAGIDPNRARELYQKSQNGEKLTPDEQAYLDRAKAARQKAAAPATQSAGGGIDWDRARALHQREVRNEKLSPEDQAYLDRAKAALRNGQGPGRPQNQPNPANQSPGKTSVDLTPLTDLPKGEKYKDQTGGLYGNGENQPPASQLKLARAAASGIKPLDASGSPAADGKIVLMSIGMSNTTMEFSIFKQQADADARKAANLVIVDSAQGGKDGAAWVNSPANEKVWQVADQRLAAAGVTLKQVQAIWIKQAMMGPAKLGELPKHADVLKADIEQILILARQHYPNVKLAYLSSRIYAGYATTQLNPEPYAYESAFAVRWTIEDQMKAVSPINADPAGGEVKSPVVLWGPYLWADGIKGRKADGLVWKREDFGNDGTHPSDSGRKKVADLLLNFFTNDETTKDWFTRKAE
jgi:lysophospholipase L1-like esterase